jgi:hypothetical protein
MDVLLLWILAVGGISLVIGALIYLACAALGVLSYGIVGALRLLSFASEQGFIGIAAYAACWFFMSPVILTASVLVGWIKHRAEQAEDAAHSSPKPLSPSEQVAATSARTAIMERTSSAALAACSRLPGRQ